MSKENSKIEKFTEKAAFSLTYDEEEKLQKIKLFLENEGISYSSMADVLRTVLDAAFSDRARLEYYLGTRKEYKTVFNPEKDGFNTRKFVDLIASNKTLRMGIAVETEDLRVLLERGLDAKTEMSSLCISTPPRLKRNTEQKKGKERNKGKEKENNKGTIKIELDRVCSIDFIDRQDGKHLEYRKVPIEDIGNNYLVRLVINDSEREE